jgi:hypothetical protein
MTLHLLAMILDRKQIGRRHCLVWSAFVAVAHGYLPSSSLINFQSSVPLLCEMYRINTFTLPLSYTPLVSVIKITKK